MPQFHSEVAAVIAEVDGELVPLESAADWNGIARRAGWPRVQAHLVRACEELAQNTGPKRNPLRRPILFVGRRSLDDGFTVGGDRILPRAQPPRVSGARNDRTVAVWFLEIGRIARYECHVSPRGLSLTLLESVPHIGLMDDGP